MSEKEKRSAPLPVLITNWSRKSDPLGGRRSRFQSSMELVQRAPWLPIALVVRKGESGPDAPELALFIPDNATRLALIKWLRETPIERGPYWQEGDPEP